MSDWKNYKLGEIGLVKTGKTPPAKCDNAFSEILGVPFVTPKDMVGDKWVLKTERYLTKNGLNSVANNIVPKNSIAVSCIGSDMGKAVLLDSQSVTNQQINTLIVNENNNYEYVYYVLSQMQNYFKSIAGGSATPILNKSYFSNITISLPSLETQNKVVNHLKFLDDKIQLNTQINQTLESMAQAIFKSWFVDFDPVHAKANALADGASDEQATLSAMSVISGKSADELNAMNRQNPEHYQKLWEIANAFPSGFDGEVPLGWESVALDKIAHYQNGLALQKFRPENEDEFLPVVKIAQLKQGFADGVEKASVNIKPECIIDNGDVIFSWSGSLVVDIWCGGKGALNQHLFKVTSKDYPKWFYYLWTCHHLAEFQRIAQDKAVTMGHIKREHLSQAICCVPKNEFINLCFVIENILNQIIEHRLQNFTLQKTRDELLPKLLSGEIEL